MASGRPRRAAKAGRRSGVGRSRSARKDRLKRLLDLVVLLLNAREPVPFTALAEQFEAYQGKGPSALRTFERDKAGLLALGIPLHYQGPTTEDPEGEGSGYSVESAGLSAAAGALHPGRAGGAGGGSRNHAGAPRVAVRGRGRERAEQGQLRCARGGRGGAGSQARSHGASAGGGAQPGRGRGAGGAGGGGAAAQAGHAGAPSGVERAGGRAGGRSLRAGVPPGRLGAGGLVPSPQASEVVQAGIGCWRRDRSPGRRRRTSSDRRGSICGRSRNGRRGASRCTSQSRWCCGWARRRAGWWRRIWAMRWCTSRWRRGGRRRDREQRARRAG